MSIKIGSILEVYFLKLVHEIPHKMEVYLKYTSLRKYKNKILLLLQITRAKKMEVYLKYTSQHKSWVSDMEFGSICLD